MMMRAKDSVVARFVPVILILVISTAMGASAQELPIADRLTADGHVLMIRHALAPGSGDPPDFTIGDCDTQRNLNESGRQQARDIGNWLRSKGVASAQIYASQWCRCLETARLLDLGQVRELPALNSFFERVQDREPNLKALREFLVRQPPDGDLVILVTHFVTIAAVTDIGVSSGEGVLLALSDGAPPTVVGRLDFKQQP
jgi:phosphohistidine phosphatase SixA